MASRIAAAIAQGTFPRSIALGKAKHTQFGSVRGLPRLSSALAFSAGVLLVPKVAEAQCLITIDPVVVNSFNASGPTLMSGVPGSKPTR
jgi:hypothetical protein